MKQALVLKVDAPVARPITELELMDRMIDRGVTPENVAAFGELVKLRERMEARNAEKQFNIAFSAMQAEIKKVQAIRPVPAKDGSIKYKVAPLEDIDSQARPIYQKHGFSVSFSEGADKPGKVTKLCILSHISGHKRENSFTLRVGSGPYGASESQADAAAHSAAKRGALCDALNIIIGHQEDDARIEGAPITAEQAAELRERVRQTASDEKAFLKYAGAKTYEEIPSTAYSRLDASLKRKERTT